MPAIIPFIPLIVGAVAGGATVAGAAVASHGQTSAANTNAEASGKAADIQAQSTREALDFQKQKLAEEDARLSGYRQLGAGSVNTLGNLYGIPIAPPSQPLGTAGNPVQPKNGQVSVPGSMLGNGPVSGQAPPGRVPPSTLGSLGSPGAPNLQQGAMVTIQAPTGETRQVPSEQAAFYQSRGAQILQQGAA